MKKIKLFSFPSFIKGKKSSGSEDCGPYKHWKPDPYSMRGAE